MKISYWVGLFLPIALLWGIAFDSLYLYPNSGVVILFFAYALATHEIYQYIPKSHAYAQIILRILSAAAVLWYFHMTGLCMAAIIITVIVYTIWDLYQIVNHVNQ